MIAAGGTAGHVVPAIAVADALRAEGAEVSFVGGERAEAELVPAAGYPLDRIRVEGISPHQPAEGRARRRQGAAARCGAAARILRRRRADAVLGGGGYVAGPVGLAAVLDRVPLVLTEADSHLGLTNRLLAPRARRVCLAFPLAGPRRRRATWSPAARSRRASPTRAAARATLGVGEEERLRARLRRLARRAHDQPGRARGLRGRALPRAARRRPPRLQPTSTAPGPHYDLRDYLIPFGLALAAADLAVARAGGSIFELAQYGLPAVLIPYPHATGDHQTANARWMGDGGAAVVVPDAE